MTVRQTIIKKRSSGTSAKTVCFTCKKCFHSCIPHCVDCSGPVYNVGNFFRAPRKTNIKEWKILQTLVVQGNYRFSKYGANGPMACTSRHADKIISNKIKSLEPRLYIRKPNKDIKGNLKPNNFIFEGNCE